MHDEGDELLARYGGIVDGIARVLGPSCEVVLHSIEDMSRSVVKIVNSQVTGRAVGAPVTDLGLKVLEAAEKGGSDVVGPYFSTLGGKTLRSVTVLLRGDEGKPIGFLCVNMDLSAPLLDFAKAFLPPAELQGPSFSEPPPELYPSSIRDLVQQAISVSGNAPSADRTRRLIEELNKKGIFMIKGAVEIAAEELGVSRHTVYYHLRDLRRSEGEGGSESSGRLQ